MFDKRLMELCPESRRYIIGNIVLQWTELIMNALMIAIVASAIQGLYEESIVMANLIIPILIIVITIICRFITTRYATRMSYLASRTVKKKLRVLIYEKLLRLGNSYREKADSVELVQESVEGVDQLESYFGQYVPQFFYAFIAPITLFIFFGMAGSWLAAVVLLVCVPLIPGAIMMVQKVAKKLLSKYWGQYTSLGSTFLENLQGMTTLKIYQADEYKNKQMNEESEHFRFVTMKVLTMQLNSIIIMDFFAYGGAAVGIIIAILSFNHGNIGLGSCIFMILLSADFFLPMRRLGSYFHVAMNGMAASDKIFKFLNIEECDSGNETINGLEDITLRDVSFAYDENREILHKVNINIPARTFVGIVGESGCGKSTVASLIMGRNRCQTGSVCVGDYRIDEISEKSLMQHINYVSHNSFFFKGTVRDNLMVSCKNEAEDIDKKLWDALEMSNLKEFFEEMDGLDTRLNENAGNLSGGQRQRLALARALLHDADIYIFDEATSNIDVESEEIILRRIEEMSRYKSIILISHRLANVVDADNIYVMENGNVVESGTHHDLMANGRTYSNIWNMQVSLENYGKEAL